jgi:enamine deaminase RidA (YjgF/YER057c/UK114 family)
MRTNSAKEDKMKLNQAISAFVAISATLFSVGPQKPMKEFLNPPGVGKPTGWTQVVSSRQGRMIFVSGQGGASAEGQMPTDFTSQAKNTFENIGRCLTAAGATFDDIVKMNYYLTDLANVTELRRIRSQYLNQSKPPASTMVQTGLVVKDLLLEVEAIAIVPE